MIFIVTNNGFLKECAFNELTFKKDFVFTNKLREAKIFGSSSKAKKFIKNNNLEAFVWNTKEEEPIINKYRVVRRKEFYNYNDFKNTHEVLEWYIEKIKMEFKTDIKFLNGSLNKEEIFDYEEAVKICYERNLKILDEIQYKITNHSNNIQLNQNF